MKLWPASAQTLALPYLLLFAVDQLIFTTTEAELAYHLGPGTIVVGNYGMDEVVFEALPAVVKDGIASFGGESLAPVATAEGA